MSGGLKNVEEAPLKSTRNISDKSATAGLPRTEIELGRFYNKDIRLERDRDGAYVVKSSFDLRRYEKPKIPLQLLDPQIIKDFNDDSELTGEGPDHLDFTANPKLIRDFMNSQLKQHTHSHTHTHTHTVPPLLSSTPWCHNARSHSLDAAAATISPQARA